MSDDRKAVFLSYASQDAEAARLICESLRQAGVEVWLDQEGGLVGGDAWDAKIRKQIAECALFVPVISANTQARGEGYFRIEWRLAAQRTHAMADDQTFLLPVVIDETRDAEARVPAEFKTVPWTRLRPTGYGGQARQGAADGSDARRGAADGREASEGGEARDDALGAFCARVQTLLGGSAVLQPALESSERGLKHRATPNPRRRVPVAAWIAIAAAVALGGYVALRLPRFSGAVAGTKPGEPVQWWSAIHQSTTEPSFSEYVSAFIQS